MRGSIFLVRRILRAMCYRSLGISSTWMTSEICLSPNPPKDTDGRREESEPIRWHFGDIAWLEKVSPIAAMYQEQNLRRAFPQGRQRSPRSPGDEKFYRALNRLIEGLLGSQIGQYSDARFNIPSQENPSSDVLQEPWYFEHLDDVGDMFNKKEKTLPHGGTAVPALPRLVWDD